MRIVIGEKNDKTLQYAKKAKAIFADEMCGIKFIKEEVEIIIPFSKILENGMVENTKIYFEELLITLNVKKVYYQHTINSYLEDLKSFYHIKFYTNFFV